MEECVDGEYQNFKSKGGAYTREHFFGKYPELKEMVANMSDEEIWHLNRGGHDPQKVYAAYASAVANIGAPTVILAKTVKGFGMGKAGEGLNSTHQQKKLSDDELKEVRDRFNIQITDEEIAGLSFRKPAADSEEMRYLQERRAALGGYLPAAQFGCRAARRAAARSIQHAARGHGRSGNLHHHGVGADDDDVGQGQEYRQAHRADRSR